MKIKNLGPVKKGHIELHDMTIFFGENGTGKTYASYAIFGILDFIAQQILPVFENNSQDFQNFLKEKTIEIEYSVLKKRLKDSLLEKINKNMTTILSQNFNQTTDAIADYNVQFTKSDLNNIISFPSENDMKSLFYRLGNFPLIISSIDGFNYDSIYNLEILFDKGFLKLDLFETNSNEYTNSKESKQYEIHRRLYNYSISSEVELITYLNRIITNRLVIKKNPIYIPAERTGINVFRKEINQNRLNTFDELSETAKQFKFISKENLNFYPKPISSYINNLNNWHSFYNFELVDSDDLHLSEAKKILSKDLIKGTFTVDDDSGDVSYINSIGNLNNKPIPFDISSSTIKSLLGIDFYLKNGIAVGDYLIIDEPELNLHPKSQKKLALMLFEIMKSGIRVIISTHSDYLIREIINLEYLEKINHLENKTTQYEVVAYDFVDNGINKIEDLTATSYLNNFDSVTNQIEEEYYNLLDKYRNLSKEK